MMRSQKLLFIILAVTLLGSLAGCKTASSSSIVDCGYTATVKKSKVDGQQEVYFNEVMAEVLNGKTNCGFGYVPIEVQDPKFNQVIMNGSVKDRKPYYILEGNFDPNSDSLSFSLQGVGYTSLPKSDVSPNTAINLKMKKDLPE